MMQWLWTATSNHTQCKIEAEKTQNSEA